MRFAKPLDEELLHEGFCQVQPFYYSGRRNSDRRIRRRHTRIHGGASVCRQVRIMGIPDKIIEHGSLKELHRECGFDAKGIADAVRDMMKDKVSVSGLMQ